MTVPVSTKPSVGHGSSADLSDTTVIFRVDNEMHVVVWVAVHPRQTDGTNPRTAPLGCVVLYSLHVSCSV